jgi:signal transduction histidine kinase
MPKEPLDLRALLEEACAELQGLADSRQIALRLPLEASAVPVSGNKSALRRLFLALLDNALKYSRPHAEVRIAIASDGARAVVSIQDFGAGIAPEDLAHIFKRFYRADEARTEGGFGLGLSLAQTIAEAHGATIGVTSTQGEGSTFTVAFEAGSAVPSGTMLQCRT